MVTETLEAYNHMERKTYELELPSGAVFALGIPGAAFGMRTLKAAGIEPTGKVLSGDKAIESGLQMYENRNAIYEAVLPEYIVTPKVTKAELSQLSDDDKWHIIQDLMKRSSGKEGEKKGTTFRGVGTGPDDGGDGTQDEPDSE